MHLLINPINIYFQSFKEQVNGWHSSGHKKWNIIILNMLRPPIFISYVLKLLSPALASPCGGKGRSTAEELALPSCLHCCWLPAVWLVRNAASSYQRALEQNYMAAGWKRKGGEAWRAKVFSAVSTAHKEINTIVSLKWILLISYQFLMRFYFLRRIVEYSSRL